jgi:CRISPR-associated protein Cas2
MLFIVCYDIENDNLRTKVAKKLLSFGLERIQFSVFFGPLTETQCLKMLNDITKIISEIENVGFLLIPLSPFRTDDIICLGDKVFDWSYLSGNKITLIL